jgi:hypothetical protein
MQIDDFLAAKREMEEEIRFATVQAVSKFRSTTGYTPRDISVYMINLSSYDAAVQFLS